MFAKEIERLGFKLPNTGTVPVDRKAESILKLNRPKNLSNIRSLIGAIKL